jgi:hypothetical protein
LEAEGREYMVDRRMVNSFLVQFVDERSDALTKRHMLDAMSKILGFSIEEKQNLGLVKKVEKDASGGKKEEPARGGFGSSLVSFLMGDDEFD